MKVGIFGSGRVGQTIGSKLATLGHEVMLGTRDPAKLTDWLAQTGGKARVGSIAETAAFGEILINATKGSASLSVLAQAGESNLEGKILIDLANVLGNPPDDATILVVANTDSLAEQIQRAHPQVKVVKACNTIGVGVIVDPRRLADGEHVMFICGNEAEAKAQVTELLTSWFGWRHIIDLGDLTKARATEMYIVIWITLLRKFGTPLFNINIVR
jgi:8-hydroxy-5-deazaflavin:NADPH oxidoreductase